MSSKTPQLITLEEHFISTQALAHPETAAQNAMFPEKLMANLKDLKDQRIASLRNSNIALQVLSHVPCRGEIPTSLCTAANDDLAISIKNEPCLAAFAFLPMHEPQAATAELNRCVKDLGFLGALIDAHAPNGAYYDGEAYRGFWTAAQELDVPIYLHPTWPAQKVKASGMYSGAYGADVEAALGAFAWGWHADTGLSVLRLYGAGVFDEFPDLKVVIGHMGEGMPFLMERMEVVTGRWGKKRSLTEVWKSNVWVTTSGMFSLNSMRCLLGVTEADRVMCSVDYPFSANELERDFVEKLAESGMVTEDELEMIAWKNAEALLKVKTMR